MYQRIFHMCWKRNSEIRSFSLKIVRKFHKNSTSAGMFHEFDKKSGYKSKRKDPPKELIQQGLRELKREINLWKSEWEERLKCDPIMALPNPGEIDVQWIFNKEMNFDEWIVTSDKDHNEGYSNCQLTLSPTGKGLFNGCLSTKVVKDGKVKYSGYCNMRSIQPTRSFKRESYYDWTSYTHLVMKVRGDGRSYMVNLATQGYFDVMWNDQYQFILFTRGGPHWQIYKIPFSKFF